jgi:hypothetical protein
VSLRSVAALYVERDSVFKALPGVSCFDQDRDARTFPLDSPVVALPPCPQWSRLRSFAKRDPEQRDLALLAVRQVRACGGVLEHPSGSLLWTEASLPAPGNVDGLGGWTLPLPQRWFGHSCEKRTWLYIVGIRPARIPSIPFALGVARQKVELQHSRDRLASPVAFAEWLIELARLTVRPA